MREIHTNMTIKTIVSFMEQHVKTYNIGSMIIGVSGGIDSALVSALSTLVNVPRLIFLILDINNKDIEMNRARKHCLDLIYDDKGNKKIRLIYHNMSTLFNEFINEFSSGRDYKQEIGGLIKANLKSRLRMCMLYMYANMYNGLVVGTGNMVEDNGVGFFTKYGDGGVDISPIGGLYKSEVYQLAKFLGISKEILDAKPTDGLWDDGRTDEDQLGLEYSKLEQCMYWLETAKNIPPDINVLTHYLNLHTQSKHKMKMPVICDISSCIIFNKKEK